MAELPPAIEPFWFEPEGQTDSEPARFFLKPLTQPQLVQLFPTFGPDGRPTELTWYRAGELGIEGGRKIDNLKVEGRIASWPRDRDRIPYAWVVACGVTLCLQAWSLDGGEAEKN